MGSYTICSRCCQNWVNCLVVTHWNGCQNQIDHLQSSWLVFEKWTRRKGELTRVALWSLGNCIASRGLRNRKQIVLFKLLYSYWLAFLCAEYNSEPWIRKAIGKHYYGGISGSVQLWAVHFVLTMGKILQRQKMMT